MPNGQVLAKLWSKEIWKKNLINVAYNALIFPTKTTGLTYGKPHVIVVPIFHILIPDKKWMGKHLL
jgi:hypothetical protein